jgi:SWIM zinc finger
MAIAAPILEQAYRYLYPSSVEGDGGVRRLRLATSGGPAANPEFFRGRLLRPVVASDLLLTVGDVARARFHVPPTMLARILLLADPVATCADDRLRFEAFSACCSVYGRVDVLPDGFEGVVVGRGTTNVDMGADLRAALAGVHDRSELSLAVGATSLEVVADATSAVERRVPLPSRWIRGFLEVQAIMADLEPVAAVDGAAARAFLRSIPKSPPQGAVWVAPAGRGLRLSHHDPGRGATPVAGVGRLRLFERAARHATGLRLYAVPGDGSTGWQLDVPGGRLTIVVSPEVWRGFSGEGRALHRLAAGVPNPAVAAVQGALGWEPRLSVEGLATTTGRDRSDVEAALAALATSGIVGFDLADGGFFRRELPFDLDRGERLQPRLRNARRLVEAGTVRVESSTEAGVEAWVGGPDGVEYRVRSSDRGWTCTCPWYGRHRGDRGPCKHVLAVQLQATEDAG